MIAVDTNILIYAHREESPFYAAAFACLSRLSEGRTAWAIPWPCVHEFLATVTHPRVHKPPTPLDAALDQVSAWMESPSLVVLAESAQHWSELCSVLSGSKVVGPKIHDARIASLCIQHGVRELWSADRDFSRFKGLTVVNPLV